MVLAIFRGRGWNSAGVRAISIVEEQGRIVFRFHDKSYQTDGPDGRGKQGTAYAFFVIPRSTKAVVLEENVQGLIGKPPVVPTKPCTGRPTRACRDGPVGSNYVGFPSNSA